MHFGTIPFLESRVYVFLKSHFCFEKSLQIQKSSERLMFKGIFSFSPIYHTIFEAENLSWKLISREEKLWRKMIFQKIFFNINLCKNVNTGWRGISKLSIWKHSKIQGISMWREKSEFKCWLFMFTHDSKELSNAYLCINHGSHYKIYGIWFSLYFSFIPQQAVIFKDYL